MPYGSGTRRKPSSEFCLFTYRWQVQFLPSSSRMRSTLARVDVGVSITSWDSCECVDRVLLAIFWREISSDRSCSRGWKLKQDRAEQVEKKILFYLRSLLAAVEFERKNCAQRSKHSKSPSERETFGKKEYTREEETLIGAVVLSKTKCPECLRA